MKHSFPLQELKSRVRFLSLISVFVRQQKAKGCLPLKEVTLKRGAKPFSLVLQPKTGKPYTLFAENQPECDAWMNALIKIISLLNKVLFPFIYVGNIQYSHLSSSHCYHG